MWFVKNNKVHLDTLHNVYQIVDEKNKTHQVTLLPKPSCSCFERGHCAHILSVQHINGANISELYKIPNSNKIK
jgi:hypothetical protein